jgi:putative transport protein
VVSRILHDGHVSIPNRDTIFHVGDQMYIVCAEADYEAIVAFIGPVIEVNWEQQDQPLVSKRVLVTNPKSMVSRLAICTSPVSMVLTLLV